MSKSTFYSVLPLNWILRCIGLSNIYLKENHLVESKSIIKSTFLVLSLGVFNILCLYYKWMNIQRNKKNIVSFSGSVQLTYWLSYFEYVIDIYLVTQSKVSLVTYFKSFDHIDTILGNANYDKIRRIITDSLIFAAVIYLIDSLFDHICWALVEGWISSTIYSVDYLYFLLNMFTVLDICSHVIQVEYRLKMIGDLLQDRNSQQNTKVIKPNNEETNIRLYVKKGNKPLNILNTLSSSKYLEMIWFSKCYLLLLDQVAFINIRYGFRVLIYSVNLLINIINNLNLAIRMINGTLQLLHPNMSFSFLPCVSSTMRAVNYSVMAIMLMYRCEQAYGQSERILTIIDKLLINHDNNCKDLKTQLSEFRTLLITRPIKFHAAKFFIMDYTLLVSLCSVIVTYTIIILQSMQ